MILVSTDQRERKMSFLKDIKNIYNELPKTEPQVQPIAPVNQELMSKVNDSLNKQPQIAPNINRK